MSYELIITEKPNAANKIALALATGKPIKENYKGVPFYKVTHGNKDIVVSCAVGHLYTLTEKDKEKWVYPVFDIIWEESSKVSKGAAFSSKYVAAIKQLTKNASDVTVATDYDIEGEVIGYNIVRFICKKKDARRMKFSTLTNDELNYSYEHASSTLDWGQVNAGITRHELDWYYGINLSRALTLAVKHAGSFKVLSSGRVQGPALKIIVDREKEIMAFKPEPFWQLTLVWDKEKTDKDALQNVEALHKEEKFTKKEDAERIFQKIKQEKKAKIECVERNEFFQQPPAPFDLTTLQTEAYRCFRIQPKETLEIAQNLYLEGVISYPRTSSQQLPPEIGYKKILAKIGADGIYAKFTEKLLSKQLKPHNGAKTDPAHPAIFPTGNLVKLKEREQKIFDLIVKRFFSTFAEPAKRESVTIILNVKDEHFISKGTTTLIKGWHELYYPYVDIKEEELPVVKENEIVDVKNIDLLEKQTMHPKRYNPASIIKELEKRNLGTKSTRAQIVDTLFQREYVTGQPIEATKLGIHIIEILEKYCESIVEESLTRHFEEEMELIREKKKKNEEILEEARHVLTKILAKFKQHEKEIGQDLIKAYKDAMESASIVGICPVCGKGILMIRKSKFGRFIACDKYPDCKTTFKLPSFGKVKTSENVCEHCMHPMITIIQRNKGVNLCINPNCKSKTEGISKKDLQELEKTEKKCPKCGKQLVLRTSVYGKFFGCSGYPKCRHTEKI